MEVVGDGGGCQGGDSSTPADDDLILTENIFAEYILGTWIQLQSCARPGSPHSRLASIEIFNAGTWWGSKSIDYDPGICDSGMSCESWEWMVKIFLIYRSLVCALLILLAQWSRWSGGWAHGASTSYLTQVVRYAGLMTPGWKVTAFMSPASNNIQILGSEARDFTKSH